MLIEDAFKQFHQLILMDKANQKEENRKLTNEVHKKAQLIDMSGLPDRHKEGECFKNILLPFEVNFIKYEKHTYIMLREFQPMVYSGCIMFDMEKYGNMIMTQPFFIKNLDNKWYIDILESDLPNDLDKHIMNMVTECLCDLEEMSYKTHDIFKTKPREIVFKNRKEKTKEKIKKPIYIYLNKNYKISQLFKAKEVQSRYKNEKLERLNSWLVRGHWRRLDNEFKRGKNQYGEYIIEGYTWVKPHQCGNKDIKVQNTYIVIGDNK